jgi:hypothetical protein
VLLAVMRGILRFARLTLPILMLWLASALLCLLAFSYGLAQRYPAGTRSVDHFPIAWVRPGQIDDFQVEFRKLKADASGASYWLPRQDLSYRPAQNVRWHYQVLAQQDGWQLVELKTHNGDYDYCTRYKAFLDHVEPLYRRISGPGEAVAGSLMGLVLTGLVLTCRAAMRERKACRVGG